MVSGAERCGVSPKTSEIIVSSTPATVPGLGWEEVRVHEMGRRGVKKKGGKAVLATGFAYSIPISFSFPISFSKFLFH